MSSETDTDSNCSLHSPAKHLAPLTVSPALCDAAQVGVADATGQDTHEATSTLVASDVTQDEGMPASVLPASQGQEDARNVTTSANLQCDIAQLPLQYQPSVLVQAYKYRLVSWQDLQQASTGIFPPQILLGEEGTNLVKHIKRKVAMRNHTDKVANFAESCDIYQRFNGRVDDILKPIRSSEGFWKYQTALYLEREAAGQCLLL